jgi:ribosomal-protein-alanine N-acetyltransferase
MSAVSCPKPCEDAALLASLHRECFEDSWDEASFRTLLAGQGAFALIAKAEAATESQAFILIQVAAGQSEILSIGTVPHARRSGLARVLLGAAAAEALARKAQEMFLEVAEDNSAALALYTAAGFLSAGRRRLYYRRPGGFVIDALMLRAKLPLRGHGNEAPSRLG